jgi:hypothetical protein
MARYSLSLPTDFEVPAVLSVGGLLVAIALAKGGYELWAVGGMVFLYGLHLAAQCLKPSARRPIDQVKLIGDARIR